ncbi:zinc-binding dehydrogenase [Nocardia otitidiscaviarum]|uniref:zinc-binding dehydrogenase n=1 Tax=Nocardia otitidiscaviarum TaxID=1823 RepID=UPI00351A9DDF
MSRAISSAADTIGGEYGPRSLRTLRAGGIVVSLASPVEAGLSEVADPLGLRARFMIVEADRAGMREIAALAGSGRLTPRVDTSPRPVRRWEDDHRLLLFSQLTVLNIGRVEPVLECAGTRAVPVRAAPLPGHGLSLCLLEQQR